MTEILRDVETPSDAELISRVRGGEVAAYGDLFARHKDAATRLARQLLRGPDSDDLVADAFAKVLSVLQGGGGPDVAFRAYLLTAVRRLHIDRVRSGQRVQTTDDMTKFDPGVPFTDTAVAGFENGAAAKAFASLPERWQLVLWHLEVEGQKPADIAPLLGMSANSVSALAYRAREGLRQAFLTMHLSDISDADCRWVNEHLGAFVRKGLAQRDVTRVQGHLTQCRRCTAMYLELDEVNSNLAGIIAPLLLGTAAVGYLAGGAAAGGTAVGVVSVLSKAKEVVREVVIANTTAAAAGGAAAAVAATAVVAVAVTQHNAAPRPDVTADPPSSVRTSAPAVPGVSPSDVPSELVSPSASSTPTAPVATLSASPTESPTDLLSPSPTDVPTDLVSPTDVPTDVPTDTVPVTDPGSGEPGDPGDDGPDVVGTPDVSADGQVTVVVDGVGSNDTVDLRLSSQDTTFADTASGADCTQQSGRHLVCTPPAGVTGAARLVASGLADGSGTQRLTITVGLQFPDYMVRDDVEVRASVNDGDPASSGDVTFRPARTPTYDFSAPVLDGPLTHTLSDDDGTDRYATTTTAALPGHVTGLVYSVSGPVTFGSASIGCTLSDGRTTMTCPDVADGDEVDLDLAADGLTGPAGTTLSLAPTDAITDPTPADDTTLSLDPGADLGLSLRVFSADPDRSGLVVLHGRLGGVRPGLSTVTYTVGAGASWPAGDDAARNAGCQGDATTLTCATPDGSRIALTVLADDGRAETPVTVAVVPGAPFVAVAADSPRHSDSVTLPGRAQHDFELESVTEATHTLSGGTDHYDLRAGVGALPDGVDTVDLTLTGGDAFSPDQADDRCRLLTSPDAGGAVRCTGLDEGGGPVLLSVDSQAGARHQASVTVLPTAPFDDPDTGDDTRSVTLSPGAHLVLSPASLGDLHQDASGDYAVTTSVGGLRPGVDPVTLTPSAGTSVTGSTTPGCAPVGGALVCSGLTDGDPVSATVTSATPRVATTLTLTAAPGGDFVGLGADDTATAALVPAADFSMTDPVLAGQALVDGADDFALTTQVGALPGSLDTLSFRITDGGTFAAGQGPGCERTGSTTVTCSGLAAGGQVALGVRSTSLEAHPATVRLVVPDGYDDVDPTDDSGTVRGLRPGTDLHLAALDADNESPANDDDVHQVATSLSGVRSGLGAVTYTLTGAARFTTVDVPGCDVADGTVTCAGPADGPVTFTVAADDRSASTRVSIVATPGDPFTELAAGDNGDGVTLLPRPTYDFGTGPLAVTGQTVSGTTDHYTVTSAVRAVPDGVAGLTFEITGGTAADQQDAGCATVDATHVRCTGLGTGRSVGFRVDSTSGDAHRVGVAVVVPRAYVDPDPTDDADRVAVEPGIDLSLGAISPAAPTAAGGTYAVSTVLSGVRSGPVTLTVSSGATVTGSTCAVASPQTVTCADPQDGQSVRLTLRPDRPADATPVSVTASGSASFTELDPGDDSVSTTLRPDVALTSAAVVGHRLGGAQSVVRLQVAGVPDGVDTLRVRLSGDRVGTGDDEFHLSDGADGADGQGAVDCATTDADGAPSDVGVYLTCTNVGAATSGAFSIDLRVGHPAGASAPVTFTLLPRAVEESDLANDSRDLTVG